MESRLPFKIFTTLRYQVQNYQAFRFSTMDLASVPSIYRVVHAWGHIPKIDMAIMSSRGQILTTLGGTNGIDSSHTYRKDEE